LKVFSDAPQRLRIAVAHSCVLISMAPVQANPLALRLLVLFTQRYA
jgi:hypothetical protein